VPHGRDSVFAWHVDLEPPCSTIWREKEFNPRRAPLRGRKGVRPVYISVVTLFVNDIDRAIDFYTKKLNWEKTMDVPMGDDTRWVTVAPRSGQTAFTLSKGFPDRPPVKIGGFSGFIIEVDDVYKTHEQLKKLHIEFTEAPRREPWGGWAMFKDSEGNEHGLHSPVTPDVSTR
jgi:lactoylglutathione lyase